MNVMKVYTSADYLAEPDLDGKRVKVQIVGAEMASNLRAKPGEKVKPRVALILKNTRGEAVPKKLVLNKTNAKAIAKAHGNKSEGWNGQWIELFPATCTSFGEANVPCIRVALCDAPATAQAPAANPA